ncbi:glycoside hydrolase family 35 protein [Sphingobium sp. YR768]|uniref:glycoside hydrolase family 35 protein n=1 Tax=Sphingobium sp. YR768 TaxID=1884365 RepID=UPI0008D425B3|nr:beta-galactosidase [Sphingobium sp. YR768]SER73186.1 Beta-galactosidase jelly roll domain-containing protein [Sphingobium sp. YR768]
MRAFMPALLIATALATPALAQQAKPTANLAAPVKTFGRVSYDARSLMIDGKRLVVWGGEFHPFRLPSPDLWRDILQKMKASGFNTVALYFDWGYHSPKQGVYDFSGIRDIDRLLTMAEEEGLYVITRAGPYVNAELSRGGFPGWLVNQRARARTDDPAYLAAVDEWLTHIHAIVAKHQINADPKRTYGVILHQIENELALTTPAQRRYMDHLYAKARADGITVPLFHNDQGRNGYWTPDSSKIDKVVTGPNDMYAFDGYPGGTCTVEGKPTRDVAAPDWGYYGPGGAKGGASASPDTPGFLAEFGGGWFDYWGSNGGYECNAIQRGKRFQRVFYGTNLANGIGIQSFYMTYGGTSWGWLPAPVVFTSYDYGSAISEPRELREKAAEMKQLGGLIASVPDLAGMVPAGPVAISSPDIQIYHNKSPETDARFLMVTHKPSNGQTNDAFRFTADLPDGRYTVPMQLNGFDAKWLVAGVKLNGQRLVYSTSELQSSQDGVMLLYGRAGEPGETVLRYASAPTVTVLEGQATSAFDAAKGDLKIDYAHQGRVVLRIEGGGRPALTLILADEAEGALYWRQGDALVRGPALVRSATVKGGTLALTGDMAAQGPLEVWAPGAVRSLTWNGAAIATKAGGAGHLVAVKPLAGPADIALPVLTDWRMAKGSPETDPAFDDSKWQAIDQRPYASTTARPDGQPNMSMDAYGFHDGDVWYRGRFTGTPDARALSLYYGAGGAGLVQAFVDGQFVGEAETPSGLPRPITTGTARFPLPAAAQSGEHMLSVMVRNNGHNWDLDSDDFHKEARGLISASLEGGPSGRSFAVPIQWKIQGKQGGETLPDPARGPANNGGQYGERMGWHLPGFDDRSWAKASVPTTQADAGTNWYRTSFALNVPKGQDATIGLSFGDASKPRSPVRYRVLIFVNGWNMGQFVAHVGPQRTFPIPEGILNHRGRNHVALAVTSDGAPGDALETVRLVTLHNVKGGLPVQMVTAPSAPSDLKE